MKSIPKAMTVILLVVVLSLAPGYLLGHWNDENLDGKVMIVHTNDTHGYYDENLGFTSVASIARDLESRGAIVFVVDAGDAFQGTASTMISHGESTIPIMNSVGYDLMVPGNHEFDYTLETYLGYTERLEFPTICSNLDWKDSGESVFREYLVLERSDIRVGFFGLLTPDTMDSVYYGYMDDVTITDPIESAQEMVDILTEEGVDYIIAVGHIGVDQASTVTSMDICKAVDGIDVFIDGHSHTEMEHGKVVDDSIQVDSGDTIIASTGSYIECVGVVTLGEEPDASLIRDWSAHDSGVDTVVSELRSSETGVFGEVIGSTLVELNGERTPCRTGETNLGDLTADSLRWLTGADIGIINGGSFRASIPVGDIDVGMVYSSIPFENFVAVKDVDGSTLREALEHSVSGLPGAAGSFLQVSGIEMLFDSSKEAGDRIISVSINGEPLVLDRTYAVASIGYVLDGGDGFTMFVDMPYRHVYGTMIDCLCDYIRYVGIIDDILGERIIDLMETDSILIE